MEDRWIRVEELAGATGLKLAAYAVTRQTPDAEIISPHGNIARCRPQRMIRSHCGQRQRPSPNGSPLPDLTSLRPLYLFGQLRKMGRRQNWKLRSGLQNIANNNDTVASERVGPQRDVELSPRHLRYGYLPLSCSFAIQSIMYREQWSSDTPSF
jgi:hypothetical protein